MADTTSIQERILDAARQLFLAKGYNGSNLRDIAREAKVSMGGIYHHFGSKEEIYLALLNQSGTAPDALQRIGKLFSDPSFPSNLADIGMAVFEVAREHQDYFKLLYIDVLEFQGKNVSHIIGGFRKGFNQLGVGLLRPRIDRGELSQDVRSEIMMRVMFDTYIYFILEEVMLGTSSAANLEMSEREMAEQMASVLLNGVLPRD